MDRSKVGRPTKMTHETLAKLEHAFLLGCTDSEACLFSNISHQTLYNYQEKHPEFVERKALLKKNPVLQARKSLMNGIVDRPGLGLKVLERLTKEYKLKSEVDVKSDSFESILKRLSDTKKKEGGG
jgi:hypothetical protein